MVMFLFADLFVILFVFVFLCQRCVEEGRTSSLEQLKEILKRLKPKYEEHQGAYERIEKSVTRIHEHLTKK